MQRILDDGLGGWSTNLSAQQPIRVREGIPRPFEVTLAFVALLGSAPLIAISGLAIRLTSRGPILFRQTRVGRDGRSFTLIKLRTMRVHEEGLQVTKMADSRVTPVGRILRKTKLDELPEFWNVLKGDMSLVGPRPEVPRYVDLNDPRWQLVLQVRPGLTDPITLRLCNEEKLLSEVAADVERFYLHTLQPFKLSGYLRYLSNRNWKDDLKVLLNTAVRIVRPGRCPAPTVSQVLLEASTLNEQLITAQK